MDVLIDRHRNGAVPGLSRMWRYYRNEVVGEGSGGGRGGALEVAQEDGLPDRLRRVPVEAGLAGAGGTRREIVIENDIAWRVHTLVDFMFGKPVVLQSCASDPGRAGLIERLLRRVFEVNGGVRFFQDLALLGAVYGYVDVLLRVDGAGLASGCGGGRGAGGVNEAGVVGAADRFVLETIDAPRAIPVLDPDDYRRLDGYIVNYRKTLNELDHGGFLDRVRQRVLGGGASGLGRRRVEFTELWTAEGQSVQTGAVGQREVVESSVNRLGVIPVVHIQNLPQPFFYEGLSDVEPLIALQNELNTRLSDRANRVTFQAFKMYLGKGIERFTDRVVGPGQMWGTDNPAATIEEFGGDERSPSEEAHINEVREAMDKTSGVTPLAAGVLRNRIGNLTSENALRVTMMGLLAKTERKRVTYGAGIGRMCELILRAADVYGLFATSVEERRVRLDWPSPLPADETQRLKDAKLKVGLGVPRAQVLEELGYGDCAVE